VEVGLIISFVVASGRSSFNQILEMKIYIKNVRIIAQGFSSQTNYHVLVDNGSIAEIADQEIKTGAELAVDARGACISVGWCDMRAHFNDPGLEHKEDLESGAQAAAAGGYTAVALLPNTSPALDTKKGIRYISGGNRERLTRLYPLGAVTIGTEGEELAEMIDLRQAGAQAFTDGLHPITDSSIILKALQYMQQFDGLLMNRPVEGSLVREGQMHEGINSTLLGMKGMPSLAEEMAIARDLRLLRYAGGRIHFSCISTSAGVELIRQAKKEGLAVSCDVAAAQLVFTDSALLDFDTNFKLNPPLRTEADRKALLAGLRDGTIDAIVSDHQPQDTESKKLEFDLADFGIMSLQTVYASLCNIEELDTALLVEKLALAPRRILGLPSVSIEKGAAAEFTLFSPEHRWTFTRENNLSKGINSPFFDQQFTGKVLGVVSNGQYQFDESVTLETHG
jgi:dihydroorotase